MTQPSDPIPPANQPPSNLPPSNQPPSGQPPRLPIDPRAAVNGPAIGLMAVGAIYLVGAVVYLASVALGSTWGNLFSKDASPVMIWVEASIVTLCTIVFGLFMLFAGFKMRRMEAYTLAIIGAIVGMVPCTCCCAGLPVGIWAIFILLKPEVKSAFK